jgi:hypothetical protein
MRRAHQPTDHRQPNRESTHLPEERKGDSMTTSPRGALLALIGLSLLTACASSPGSDDVVATRLGTLLEGESATSEWTEESFGSGSTGLLLASTSTNDVRWPAGMFDLDEAGSLQPVDDHGQDGALGAGEDDATGTDPRAFGTKFMPYYRYTRLENDLKVKELVMFGLVRLDANLGATYELPVSKRVDYSGVEAFQAGGGLEPGPGSGYPGGGVPFADLDPDGDETGVGDAIFRLMGKSDDWKFDSPLFDGGSGEVMGLFEITVPTATEDVLGEETLVASPGFAVVADVDDRGSFIAMMNFFDFDVIKDSSREDILRFRGRWFFMKPLTPPAFMAAQDPDIPDLGAFAGLYLLPELQPVYDFENSEFSVWLAPEVGKVYREGQIFYIKPGWGIDSESNERDFTFEMGWRYFF